MDPLIIWLDEDFTPTDESTATMGKVIDGDEVYFILPGGTRELGGPGSGFFQHKGRDATNERGGSLPKGEGAEDENNNLDSEGKLKPLKMEDLENEIADQKYETAAAYTSLGDLMFMKDGDKDSVDFTDEELERMEGNIITHNHPSGATFSLEDFQLFFYTKASEIRAVSPEYLYVLKAPVGYDHSNGTFFKSQLGAAQEIVRQRVKTDDWKFENHLVAKEWAKSIGLQYYREKRGE